MKEENIERYPDELSEEESEEFEYFKMFGDSNSYKEDFEKATKHAKKTKGIVYTMVDGENNKTYYLKGIHYVNRFAFCVLRKK